MGILEFKKSGESFEWYVRSHSCWNHTDQILNDRYCSTIMPGI